MRELIMKKKGMSQALTIVVAAVVLIVVSLIIITITTNILGTVGTTQNKALIDAANQQSITQAELHCKTQCLTGNKEATTVITITDINGKTSQEIVECNVDGNYYKLLTVCELGELGDTCIYNSDCETDLCGLLTKKCCTDVIDAECAADAECCGALICDTGVCATPAP